MRKMYRTEGLLSFWKGILPPILVETPKRAWKFLTFEQFKILFNFGGKDATPTPLVSILGLYLKHLSTQYSSNITASTKVFYSVTHWLVWDLV